MSHTLVDMLQKSFGIYYMLDHIYSRHNLEFSKFYGCIFDGAVISLQTSGACYLHCAQRNIKSNWNDFVAFRGIGQEGSGVASNVEQALAS